MPNETITVSKEKFRHVAADLIRENEHVSKICKDVPVITMAFIMFSTELEKKLFEESEEN